MNMRKIPIDQINPAAYNPRKDLQPGDPEYEKLKRSIQEFGYVEPVIWNKRTGNIVGGHQRYKILLDMGMQEVDCVVVDLDETKEKALNIALNKIQGDWDYAKLKDLLEELDTGAFDIELTGFGLDEIEELIAKISPTEQEKKEEAAKTLAERFIVPPFSVLDTRQGYWQERKRKWLTLGIKGELGRDSNLTYASSAQPIGVYKKKNEYEEKIGHKVSWEEFLEKNPDITGTFQGTSIFDPVLCEISYRWFCTTGGKILDPFAGGSVRGVTAAVLGYLYTGIELREEQVESNRQQWEEISKIPQLQNIKPPQWITGDSNDLNKLIQNEKYDMIFTCPPYFDLEVYSNNEKDISNLKSYEEFLKVYKNIFAQAVEKLNNNRFAVIVVGEIRDKKTGIYRSFVADNIRIFTDLGLKYYNEAILINQISSLTVRASTIFKKRKLGRVHQNVLMFVKGDIEEIRQDYNNFSKNLKISKKHENVLVFYKGELEAIKETFPPEEIEVSDIVHFGGDQNGEAK